MEVNVSLYSRRPLGLLDIPLEIRRQIYQYCLVRRDPVILPIFIYEDTLSESGIRDAKNSLLLVSKKVGFEALEVLYRDNVFQIDLHDEGRTCLKRNFTEANMQKIRKIQFVMRPPSTISYRHKLDSTLWSPILGRLTRLSVVAKQPLVVRIYINEPSLEQTIEGWIEWLRTTLQYIASQLSNSCIVEVDDDDRRQTSTLVRECLPSGYRKVQTLAGDICFGRNDYYDSEDEDEPSGCWKDDY